MWAGASKHFLVFAVRHGTMVNYVGFVAADEEMKESWSAPGDPEVLCRAFEGWDPRVGEGLKQVDKTYCFALYDRDPLLTWATGWLARLGDAAHPMLPLATEASRFSDHVISSDLTLAGRIGHSIFIASRASTSASVTTASRTQRRSDGTTYQGAPAVDVLLSAVS